MGVEYDVEIWDSSFSGTSTAFVLGAEGFTINEEGDADDPFKVIVCTSVSFTMQMQDANVYKINTFITDLLTAAEKRFQVLITKGASPAVFWFGNVLTDISMQHDRSPSAFEVTATCGMGSLSKIDYNDNGTAYTGSATLLEHAVNCLTKIGTLDTFFTTGWAITTVVNWYEDSHVTGAANDPFSLTRNDHRTYYEVDGQGVKKYMSCFDVLKTVVGRMGARIFLSDGKFRIEQLGERENVTITERRYQKDGTYITSASVSHDMDTLNQTSEARLTGGAFDWLPAVRKVKIHYKVKNWINHLAGANWSSAGSSNFTIPGMVHTGGNVIMRIMMGVFQTIQNVNYTSGGNIAIIYRLKIKIGSYYMRRSLLNILGNSVTYEPQGWVSGVNYYYFHRETFVPPIGTTMPVDVAFLDFMSTPLPDSGDMEVKLEFHDIRKMDTGASVSSQDTIILTWQSQNPLLQVMSNGNAVTDLADKTYTAEATGGSDNSETYEVETITGDGTTINSLSRLQVYNGIGYVDSSQWRIGTSGSWYDISELHAKEILSLRQKCLRVYKGSIRGSGLAHSRWAFDTNFWIMTEGRFTANSDTWNGTWIAVARNYNLIDTTITTLTPTDHLVPAATMVPVVPVAIPLTKIGSILSTATTSATLPVGGITNIKLNQSLLGNAFMAGDAITIVNPENGYTQNLKVITNTTEGDTTVAVSGYIASEFPPGSFIIVSPQNQSIQNYGSGSGSGSGEFPGSLSSILEFFSQFFRSDATNDPAWRLESPNITLETDENAGDGATAGIRFDGDGLQSFTASSATAGVKIGLAGKLELANLATGTSSDLLIIEGGEVKTKSEGTVVTDHGVLTGLSDDDHSQYHNDTRGDARYFQKTEHLNSSAGAGDAGKPIKLAASGNLDPTMLDDEHYVHLIAVLPGQVVTQTAGFKFYNASYLVPNDLNNYILRRVDWAITNNTSSSGALHVGLRLLNTSNSSVSTNIFAVTFNASDVRQSATGTQTLTAGYWLHAEVNFAIAGTLDGTVEGLLLTLYLKKT